MNKKAFGSRNWFIKNAIYEMLLKEKSYFGIDAIVYNNKLKLSDEEINVRYKLCNLIKNYLMGESYINNKDIMAVLYKIDFTIVDGRLNFAINYKDKQDEVFKESLRLAKEEGYDV